MLPRDLLSAEAGLQREQFGTWPRSWDNRTAQIVDQAYATPPNRRSSLVEIKQPNRRADPRLNHIRQFRLEQRSLDTEHQ